MKKQFVYGLFAAVTLILVSGLGVATLNAVYNPIAGENVPVDRVAMDDVKRWADHPGFSRWNDMQDIRDYLQQQGTTLDAIRDDVSDMSRAEQLSLGAGEEVFKTTKSDAKDERAVSDISCDADDRQLEFTLTNIGDRPWFLVDQDYTAERRGDEDRKLLSDSYRTAEDITLFVNDYLANGKLPVFENGEQLFTDVGETFAVACQADFLRAGKSVECELEPIPLRTGIIPNTFELQAPGFTERGELNCS